VRHKGVKNSIRTKGGGKSTGSESACWEHAGPRKPFRHPFLAGSEERKRWATSYKSLATERMTVNRNIVAKSSEEGR